MPKKNTRQTGKAAASNAGKVLAASSTKAEKSAAASALSQAPKRK